MNQHRKQAIAWIMSNLHLNYSHATSLIDAYMTIELNKCHYLELDQYMIQHKIKKTTLKEINMQASRQEMIRFIKEKNPSWTGLMCKGVTGGPVPFESIGDKQIAGVYYNLVRRIRSGYMSKQKQLLLPL
jgi:hypothetical protein